MDITPGIYWRTIRITEPHERINMQSGIYVLFPWVKTVVRIDAHIKHLNIDSNAKVLNLRQGLRHLFGLRG